jgi:hypothetical protein
VKHKHLQGIIRHEKKEMDLFPLPGSEFAHPWCLAHLRCIGEALGLFLRDVIFFSLATFILTLNATMAAKNRRVTSKNDIVSKAFGFILEDHVCCNFPQILIRLVQCVSRPGGIIGYEIQGTSAQVYVHRKASD